MIKLRNIEKCFKTKAGFTYVLRRITLDVAQGEFLTIMGPSGAGKSTLLGILGMYDHSWEGGFQFLEYPLHRLNAKERAMLNKRFVGFVFQQFHLLDDLTVAENLDLPLSYRNVPKSEQQALLSSKDAANLAVVDANVDDQVPAPAPDIVSRAIAEAPANLVRGAVLRGRDQTAFEFDTFSSSPVIRGGHRPGQRHCQLIFQNCPVKHLCHRALRSGLRENSLGVAQFTDAAIRKNKINEAGRNDKLAVVMGGLQVAVLAHRAPIRFTRFLEVVRADVGVRVKGSEDLQTLGSAPGMGRHFDGAAVAWRPPDHAHCPRGILDDESPLFMASRRPRLRFPPGEFQRRAYGRAPETGVDAFHESECSSTNREPPQAACATQREKRISTL
jgi:ABC-type ATPase involved in cell division